MNDTLTIHGLCCDSRRVKPGDLFIALPGKESDGRHFIDEAIHRGAVAVLCEKREFTKGLVALKPLEVPMIEYNDLKQAIGFIAAQFYGQPSSDMKVIGITGTNGKTSISHFIAQLSGLLGKPCGVIGTLGAGFLNNLDSTGLTTPGPIRLQEILATLRQQGAELTAMEVTSHALAQGRVLGTKFNTAIFTNLTRDHLDYHDNFENYFHAKLKLFTECNPDNAIINLDDPYGQRLATEKFPKITQIIGVTTEPEIPQQVKETLPPLSSAHCITTHDLNMTAQGFTARLHTPWGIERIQCPLLGRFNLSNVVAAVAALCVEGFSFKEVLAAVPELKPVMGRMNHLGGGENEPSIVIDYAHTPDALSKVLGALRSHCKGKLMCVFGCGGDRDPGKRPEMAKVAESLCDHIIVTQDNPRMENPEQIIQDILQGFSKDLKQHVCIEPDRAKAIHLAIEQARPTDMIVIAGKGHETYQIIGAQQIPFSDELHAKQALERRHACLH